MVTWPEMKGLQGAGSGRAEKARGGGTSAESPVSEPCVCSQKCPGVVGGQTANEGQTSALAWEPGLLSSGRARVKPLCICLPLLHLCLHARGLPGEAWRLHRLCGTEGTLSHTCSPAPGPASFRKSEPAEWDSPVPQPLSQELAVRVPGPDSGSLCHPG